MRPSQDGPVVIPATTGLVTSHIDSQALRRALGLVCRRPNKYEQRRSYLWDDARGAMFAAVSKVTSLFAYNGELFGCTANGKLWRRNGADVPANRWKQVGTFTGAIPAAAGAPELDYLRTAELNGNAYLPFASGVFRLTSATDTAPTLAGLPRGREVLFTASGATGIYTVAGQSAAYRIVWRRIDANNNLVRGAPSGRFVYSAAGVGNVSIKTWIPVEIVAANDTAFACEVYRSRIAAAGATPDDLLQLVWQTSLTATDIANGFVTFIDQQPDGLRGEALYTNPDQGGIANANQRPVICQDIVEHKGTVFYFNTKSIFRAQAQMLAIPQRYNLNGAGAQVQAATPIAGQATYTFATAGTYDFSGLDVNNFLSVKGCTNAGNNGDFAVVSVNAATRQIVVTNGGAVSEAAPPVGAEALCAALGVAGVRFHASYAENVASKRWAVSVAGTDLANVQATIPSLLRVINQTVLNPVIVATDISRDDEAPGKLLFEGATGGLVFSLTAFGFSTSAASGGSVFANKFAPALNVALAATQDVVQNRAMWSKPGQPEHVPEGNQKDFGSRTAKILRALALRDSVLVWKEDGLFRIYGDGSGAWNFMSLDPTLKLRGPNLLTALFGEAYAVTNRGCVAVSDYNRRLISGAVEDHFTRLLSSTDVVAHMEASEVDGLVYLYDKHTGPSSAAGLYDALSLTYCPATNKWSGDVYAVTNDPSPLAAPGVRFGSQLFRHLNLSTYAAGAYGDDILAEALYDSREIATLRTFENSMPIPGDGFWLTCNTFNIGTGVMTYTLRTGLRGNAAPYLRVGDLVRGLDAGNGVFYYFRVTAVDVAGVATLAAEYVDPRTAAPTFTPATDYYFFAPIGAVAEWHPFVDGNPNSLKTFVEVGLLLGDFATATQVQFGFSTELDPVVETESSTLLEISLRASVPAGKQRGNRLVVSASHTRAGEFFNILGLAHEFEVTEGASGGPT